MTRSFHFFFRTLVLLSAAGLGQVRLAAAAADASASVGGAKAELSGAGSQVLLPALQGLSFVSSEQALERGGTSASGLRITGVPLLETEEFRALATAYLGQPLTLDGLNRLTRDVVLYFRRNGRPVVDVLVPEQNITTGTVQILVVEARLGAVRTEGNVWFTAEQLIASVRAQSGATIDGGPLLDDIVWINQNPFSQVDLVFMRGSNAGETDVVLRTRDRYPLRVYAGYEDSGNALTGFDRVIAGANWGNAFGRDEQLNYQLTASPDFKKMVAHSGSYIMPLSQLRHTLTVFGSFAESEPTLAGGMFDLKGRTAQLSARYRVPVASQHGVWNRDVTAGFDFKRSNNDLSFGGTQVFAQETDVVQASVAFNATRTDPRGATSGQLAAFFSPGGITSGNHSGAYRAARSLARPDYVYARLELERFTKLPAGFGWLARGMAQWSNANLLGSEQLGLGGGTNLRGYEEREANGDRGFMLLNELHGPRFSLAQKFGRAAANDGLTPLVFLDYGTVASHDRLPGELRRLELASAGVGLRYHVAGNFNLRSYYGWQLKRSGVSDLRRDERGHISAVFAY